MWLLNFFTEFTLELARHLVLSDLQHLEISVITTTADINGASSRLADSLLCKTKANGFLSQWLVAQNTPGPASYLCLEAGACCGSI